MIGHTRFGIEQIETIVWATPREGLSLEDLIQTMRALGNDVLDVDRDNNCLKVIHCVDRIE